ncbi:MAG: NAD(P)/FAD-dependent oxidoreductase, partial [Phycisphaera sp. TMED9]
MTASFHRSPEHVDGRPNVVVVGGGFGGVSCVRALRRANANVVLVDRMNHTLFQPLLYQLATGVLDDS